jgi:flagellar hook assembly protein FlgD
LPEDCKNAILNIYNAYGNSIRHIDISGMNAETWDCIDNKGNKVKEGLYLYNIIYDNNSSQFNKLLIVN